MLTENTIRHLPSTDHILCKRGTSEILLGYYDLPLQPTNIILIQGLLWRRKSRIFLIDGETLKARSLPIIPRVLLAISYISPRFAGLIICTRRDAFLPNCQTCTRGPYTERQMRWNLSNGDITKPVCRVSQCVPKVKASS
jgi:hypothetical protein